MDNETKKRYEEFKRKQKERNKQKIKFSSALLRECLEVLKNNSRVLNDDQEQYILEKFSKEIPVTRWGRIDWSNIDNHKVINDYKDLLHVLDTEEYYIIWDQYALPIIQCDLEQIIEHIDDVLSVSFDTWLISNDFKTIVEFYHEGEITVGKLI